MRRAIAAEHDLLLCVVERVERVEELRLRAFLARHELNVVHQQHVDAAIPFPEIEDAVVANRIDHLVHETLGRDVGKLQVAIVLEHELSDRVHQVRLAETHAAVDEERVVGARRRFSNRATRRVRELIRRADDERVERVAGIQAPQAVRRRRDRAVERGGLVGVQRDIRVGLRVGHEIDDQLRPFQLRHRLADDRPVMLRQPVLEEGSGHPDRD